MLEGMRLSLSIEESAETSVAYARLIHGVPLVSGPRLLVVFVRRIGVGIPSREREADDVGAGNQVWHVSGYCNAIELRGDLKMNTFIDLT